MTVDLTKEQRKALLHLLGLGGERFWCPELCIYSDARGGKLSVKLNTAEKHALHGLFKKIIKEEAEEEAKDEL